VFVTTGDDKYTAIILDDNGIINLRHTYYTLNNLDKVTYTKDIGVRKMEENGLTWINMD
jgi:hypothetical protein